jgi:c-di-GMP-binding flagellar brake protein YcgR
VAIVQASWSANQRRREARKLLSIEAIVKIDENALSAKTLDLSEAGMSALMFRSLPLGTACRVELRWRSDGHTEFLQTQARVVNSALAEEGGFRIGMSFASMDQSSHAVLAMLLEKR